MLEFYHITQYFGSDLWLFCTGTHTMLYEAGCAVGVSGIISDLKKALDGRKLDWLVLSHSHYDHCSAAPAIKAAFPEVTVCASEYAAYVFTRPGAIATMKRLNRDISLETGLSDDSALCDNIHADRILHDGDIIDLGSATFEVLETPGHTKCSITLFSPEESLLLLSETLGTPVEHPVPEGDFIVSTPCMTGFNPAFEAHRRVDKLAPKYILVPHYDMISGKTADNYRRCAVLWAERGVRMVLNGVYSGKSMQELLDMWKSVFRGTELAQLQPEHAFDENARNIIPAICRENGVPVPQ